MLLQPPDSMNPGTHFLATPQAVAVSAASADVRSHVYTVSGLNRGVRSILESELGQVWVQGELSNCSRPASGHLYFTLKDDKAQLRCAMFRRDNSRLSFAPADGMGVLACGRVSLYEARGNYQLIVDTLKLAGAGELHLAYERLKQKLDKEGLFAAELKRKFPEYPVCIGVITSATGAAIRDVLSVLRRRWPLLQVIVYPVPVQGDTAAPAICEMLAVANQRRECEVLMLARGGGSLEDLWPFNEETVARAIRASEIPVVSGVGHEVDTTIADLVADKRGATPSAAAELISPNREHELSLLQDSTARLLYLFNDALRERRMAVERLAGKLENPMARITSRQQRTDELLRRMERALQALLERNGTRVQGWADRFTRLHPEPQLQRVRVQHERLQQRLQQAMERLLMRLSTSLQQLERALQAVSPRAVLQRGYAILEHPLDGSIVTDAARLRGGETLRARLHKGELELQVARIIDASE